MRTYAILAMTLASLPALASAAAASMETFTIPSRGAQMNALMYLSAGTTPKPVAIFLHGYPGNEKNLDLAQAVRRAGYHALYLDYRGNWGSGGTFSFANASADVQSALAWVGSPDNAKKYRMDNQRIALVGHSMGGWLALTAGLSLSPRVCIAGLAAWNLGWAGERFAEHADEKAMLAEEIGASTLGDHRSIKARGEDLIAEMMAAPPEWDYLNQAQALSRHAVYLAAATGDGADGGVHMHGTLAKEIRAAGGKQVRYEVFQDDHSFSASREKLARSLTAWLRTDCAKAQAK